MADAEPEAEETSEDGGGGGGGGGGRAPIGSSSSAVRLAPLGPEQLRRVLEQVTKAQLSPEPSPAPPPPQPAFVLQDAAGRLRDAAQQAALKRGPGAEPQRPPRLLPPQQLEAICVKVAPGGTPAQERPMPPLAAIQPQALRSSLPPLRSPSLRGVGVTGPQLLRVQPLPQPCHLSSPPQPPLQVFVQRLPTLSPVSVKRDSAPKAPSGQGPPPAPPLASDPLALMSVSPSSANMFLSNLHTKHTEKLKKSVEVKTRSGRISRPPKYKARDYRFIKTEDLADGHPSDSDDYSELSVEEDEDQRVKGTLFNSSTCSLRPKTFKCQTCEKSYIGKGGLARHFKLNPSHGQPEPVVLLSEKTNGHIPQECTEDRTIISLVSPAVPTAVLRDLGVPSQCAMEAEPTESRLQSVDAEEALVSEPENRSYSAHSRPGRHSRPRTDGDSKVPGTSATTIQQNGAAQLPVDPGATAGWDAVRSKARSKARSKECDQEDPVASALSQLTPAVTVYDFLLMKVGQNHPGKPLFPAVYKEFEELHKMVKKMCQEYLRSSVPCCLEPLEISNNEVAASLGITEENLRKRTLAIGSGGLPGRRASPEADRVELVEACGQKRESETTEGLLASVKRTRKEPLPQDGTEPLAVPTCAPADREGCDPQVNGCSSQHYGEGHPVAGTGSSPSGLPAGQQLRTFAEGQPCSGSVDPAPLPWEASGRALPAHIAGCTGSSPHSSGLHSEGPASLLPGGAENAGVRVLGSTCASHTDKEQPGPSIVTFTGATTQKPETALSPEATLVDNTPGSASEPGPPHGPEGSQLPALGLGNHVREPSLSCVAEEQAEQVELESTVAIGEGVTLAVTSGCHALCSQGQEQIFIQTADGLILSHPGTVMTQENVVLVAEAEGPALPMGLLPGGIPLEAMEAFLAANAAPSP
ncbi:zinc finger protein 839 [Rhynchocyon petersi]